MSDLPGRPRNSALPMGLLEFREELWRRAGVSLEDRAEALGQAFRKTKSLLDAKRTELVSYQGDYQPVQLEDNAAQLRAAAEIFDLSGVRVCKQEQGGAASGPIHIHLNAPWFMPEGATNITPKVETDEASSPTVIEQEPDATR